MRRVALGLLALLVFSIPFDNGVSIPGVGSVSRMFGLAAFAGGVAALFYRGRVNIRPPSLFIALALLFVLYAMASYFWSAVPSATFSEIVTFGQLFVLSWLVWQYCRTEGETVVLMQAFVLGCFVIIGVALFTFFAAAESGFRNVGSLNPNEFAIVTALGIPMAWYLSLRVPSKRFAWLNSVYPAFAVFGVILSASRGGLLTTVIALAIIPASLPQLSRLRQLLLFAVITTISWAGFMQAPRLYPELNRNLERLSTTSEELTTGDLTSRTVIWEHGIEVFHRAPLIGHGVGTFAHLVAPRLGTFKEAHNAFLSVAVGSGLIGFVIFVAMVVTALFAVLRAEPGRRPFFVILFVALFVGMMPTNSDTDKFAWFILALLSNQRPLVLSPASSRSLAESGLGDRYDDPIERADPTIAR